MEDYDREAFTSEYQDALRRSFGFADSVKVEEKECSSIHDALMHYDVLSRTERSKRAASGILPPPVWARQARSFFQAHQDTAHKPAVLTYVNDVFVVDYDVVSMDAGTACLLGLRDSHQTPLQAYLHESQLEEEVLETLMDAGDAPLRLYGSFLDAYFLVVKNEDVVPRGPWYRILDAGFDDDEGDEPPLRVPVETPDLTLAQ